MAGEGSRNHNEFPSELLHRQTWEILRVQAVGGYDQMDQTFLVIPIHGERVLWLVIDMETNF